MKAILNIPDGLYGDAERAAVAQGVSVEKFIAGAIEQKLRAGREPSNGKHRVQLPLVPSKKPGSRQLTAHRVAELLSEDDVSA